MCVLARNSSGVNNFHFAVIHRPVGRRSWAWRGRGPDNLHSVATQMSQITPCYLFAASWREILDIYHSGQKSQLSH